MSHTPSARDWVLLQARVLRTLLWDEGIRAVTPSMLADISDLLGADLAAFWCSHSRDDTLRCHTVWRRATSNLVSLARATKSGFVVRGRTMAGHVWSSGQPEWTTGAETAPGDVRHQLGIALGVPGVLAIPVRGDSGAIGVLEFFTPTAGPPDAETLKSLVQIGRDFGHFVIRNEQYEHQALLLQIIDATDQFAGMSDADGRILYLNRAGRRLLGVGDREDLSHARVEDFCDSETATQLRRVIIPTAVRDGSWSGRAVVRRRDGSLLPMTQTIVSHRSAEGRFEYLSMIGRSFEDEAQEPRRVAEARTLEAVGLFAGGVAHDLKNLLSVVLGLAEVSLLDPSEKPCGRATLEQIRAAAARAGRLSRQLMAFERTHVLKLEPLDPRVIVRDLERILATIAGPGIQLEIRADRPCGQIEVDRSQLERVLVNLVANSRDAMPRGGRVAVSFDPRTLGAELDVQKREIPAGEYACLEVIDTGTGMDEATQARVFERHFSTKPASAGSGLGLDAVRSIVAAHHGFIQVESAPLAGTTMRILIPTRAVEPGVESGEVDATEVARGTETVLVVDDEPAVLEVTRLALQSFGYHVLEAARVEEALRCGREHEGTIHLLLVDLHLPVRDGRALAVELQAMRPGMRIILVSGDPLGAAGPSSRPGEPDACLEKPFEISHLARTVRAVLDRHPAEAAGASADRRAA